MEEITKRSITSLVVKLMGSFVLASSLKWIAYMPIALSNVDLGADDFPLS